jgi:hypothetical protein
MKVRIGLYVTCLVCVALAGLLLRADPPKGEGAKPSPDPILYAKAEVRGELVSKHEDWEPMCIVLANRPKEAKLPLIVSHLERWTKERFEKAHGKPVRVSGTLEPKTFETKTGGKEDHLALVAKTMDVVVWENGGKSPKDEPYYAKVEARGTLHGLRVGGEPMYIVISQNPKYLKFPLMVSKLEEWTEEKWGNVHFRRVRVGGNLEFMPSNKQPGLLNDGFVLVAKNLDVIEEDEPFIDFP